MYDHFIAVDWAQKNMAIARLSGASSRMHLVDVPSDLNELQLYLSRLKGKKTLTFEESSTSQWLYTELKEYVDELIVCDPFRNRLLSEGPKTDKIDASKLVQLLQAKLLKPVFHSGDQFIYLRKLVSGYSDLVIAGVRLKNQRSAMFRSVGLSSDRTNLPHPAEQFVLRGLDQAIEAYEQEKKRYEKEFHRLTMENAVIAHLVSIPGIGEINAVKIAAIVVDPRRFPTLGHFLSYCGLVRLARMSGGRSYGRKQPRYCRALKCVFKTAALVSTQDNKSNPIRDYYLHLTQEKKLAEHHARNKAARKIASVVLGVLKRKKSFDPSKVNPGKDQDH